jgi:hypothetical protein
MPFDLTDRPASKSRLPPLAPVQRISRPVSMPEYYHASVAASGRTLEVRRENGFCAEGAGQLSAEQWQAALDQVAAHNPGTRLRMIGEGRRARWDSDGLPPRLHMVEHSDWDARSESGADFLYETAFSLTTGPTVELVVVARPDNRSLLVLRSHHAVMDGMGSMHFLHELFRALRGEPLAGTNAAYSDVDLMLSVGAKHSTSRHVKTVSLTGLPQGDDSGDEWRRISLGKPRKNQLGRVAGAVAEFTHRHTDLPVLIGVPVDLRRHAPGLLSTANFTNMLLVRLDKGEGGEQFKQRLKEMLDQKMEAVYPRILGIFKWMSLSQMDRMLSRNPKNYRTKKALETAVISNLGRQDSAALSCPGFNTERMFLIPIKGSAFATMICIGEQVELTINLPRVLASNGRFDAFVDYLMQRLENEEAKPLGSATLTSACLPA